MVRSGALTAAAVVAVALTKSANGQDLCLGTCEGTGESKTCTFRFHLDIFAGETGYYTVEGCDGVQPTLGMLHNVTYVFDQSHATNWFHPLGFAYGPDGVYGLNEELEKGVPAPGGSITDCDASTPCQYPQYMLDGEALCDNDPCDEEDFGLDQYEGVWFSGGRDDWLDAGNFSVHVRITDPATTELFYFCHIHNHMSGRIKIIDAITEEAVDPVDYTPIPYEYHTVSGFDEECGTFNASVYENLDQCEDMQFHCNQDANVFTRCMAAINCKMHVEMRTSMTTDPTAQFMYQMIAHHVNAVNMAKIMLKLNPGSLKCGTSYDGRRRQLDNDPFCNDNNDGGGTPAVTLLWDIVNTQNQQITFMRAWLSDNLQPAFDYCHDEDDNATLIIVLASCIGVLVVGAAGAFAAYKLYFAKPSASSAKLAATNSV